MRDPNGIRPAFWFEDDEVVVVASERPVIQTAFNVSADQVQEVQPGHALIIKRNGEVSMPEVKTPGNRTGMQFRADLLQPRQRQRHLQRAQGIGAQHGSSNHRSSRARPG